MKELKLTPDAARAIVESARSETLRSVQESCPPPPPFPLAPDIRLARLQTAWRRDESGLWRATARFVVEDVGRVDPSFEFEVVAPMARSQPYGSPQSERFYVVWRGRWESLQTPAPYIPRYVAGVATAVYTNADGNYQIDNVGVQNVKIPGDAYADWGILYLSPTQFEWSSSSLDIVGKKEARIKTSQKEVVTGVALNANGTLDVTTERISVIG